MELFNSKYIINPMVLLLTIALLEFSFVSSANITIKMPEVRPIMDDAYVCTAFDIPVANNLKDAEESAIYLTSYMPLETHSRAHHILLYACSEKGSMDDYWYCGEMHDDAEKKFVRPICRGGLQKIIYAWAMDAPGLNLPTGVSFKVGGNTGLKHIILQVHYKDKVEFDQNPGLVDTSGLMIAFKKIPTEKLAGIYLVGTDGLIPGQSIVYLEAACRFTGRKSIYPFAYRAHSHRLGQVTVGYRVRGSEWLELGRKSPQDPQMFYNVTNPNESGEIYFNDFIAARCIMNNANSQNIVSIGATRKDEMCNFYLMYWVHAQDADQLNDKRNQYCFRPGFPSYNWCDELGLDCASIPITANVDPRTGESIVEDIADRKEKANPDYIEELGLENSFY